MDALQRHTNDQDDGSPPISRRDLLRRTAANGAAVAAVALSKTYAEADNAELPAKSQPVRGLLYPQQNQHRNLLDLSGLWQFQLDPNEEGEAEEWFRALPSPRLMPVPCSWNDLFDDAHNYLGLAWYSHEIFMPSGWRGHRIFLRVGSATYLAKLWMNGKLLTEHSGGQLPFVVEVTESLLWDQKNRITIAVENKQLPERVPPGAGPGGGGVAGVMGGFPLTTYDFFPYSGLHRPVQLFSVPPSAHIDDVTVVTNIEGKDGVVNLTVAASGQYAGRGKVRLGDIETDLTFGDGTTNIDIRIPSARLWRPNDPHLYPLTVMLSDGPSITDSYSLDIGIRTIAVRKDQLLLNGQPIKLTGFGKHEDFPLSGRGENLPMWIRDYELLRWIGANSYRTSHYPYAEEAMRLADRLGVLVINEIPAVGLNFEDSAELTQHRLTQCKQQIKELITRDKNHPSTIMWNVANEPMAGPPLGAGQPAAQAVEAGQQFFRQVYDETRRLDPTRPITLVGVQGGPPQWHGIFDVVCINRYYGWYTHAGQLDQAAKALADELDQLHDSFRKPIIITEFGTDTTPGAHNMPPEMWTEEYQVEFLRRYLTVAAERPFMAGMHVWAFADFKTGQATMRADGMNLKGVFTRDGRPKMAAHFLRTQWSRK